MATFWPSSTIGANPVNVADDGAGVMTMGITMRCPVPFTYTGARFYAAGPVVGKTAFATFYKFNGGSSVTALQTTAAVTLVDGWNSLMFPAAVNTITDTLGYIIAVEVNSKVYTYTSAVLEESRRTELATTHSMMNSLGSGNCGFYGYSDTATTIANITGNPDAQISTWFGVDLIEDQGAATLDTVSFTDSISTTRSGLPTSVTATGTVTDTSSASATASATRSVSAGLGPRKVIRYLHKDRTTNQSLVDPELRSGPGTIMTTVQPKATELGLTFTVSWSCTLTGFRIWKAPVAFGTVPITLWDFDTQEALITMNVTWVADEGGWREYDFPAPYGLTANKKYVVSYCANAWVNTFYFFNAQNYVEPPFHVDQPGVNTGSGPYLNDAHGFPSSIRSDWWWLDPRVEWTDTRPGYSGGLDYFNQWPDCPWPQEFVFTVFAMDQGTMQRYKDWGVNVVMPARGYDQRDEIVALGLPWIGLGEDGATSSKTLALDPAYRAKHLAYYLMDEPDLTGTYVSPADMLARRNAVRAYDSGKPTMVGFGFAMLEGQTFIWAPTAAAPELVHSNWRQTADLVDIISGDNYKLNFGMVERGPWNYGKQIDRLKNITDGRCPTILAIETCILPNTVRNPTPAELVAAAWQVIIHGGLGVIWFDHQFNWDTPDGVHHPADFQAILNSTDGRKEAVASFMTFVKSLGTAAVSPEAGLLTSKSSSNTTAGPVGAEPGVPIDTKTAIANGFSYLFAQASRPGDTVGTFNCPTAAGKTITVLNESRTITADINGTFTDDFTGDYVTHVYRWS